MSRVSSPAGKRVEQGQAPKKAVVEKRAPVQVPARRAPGEDPVLWVLTMLMTVLGCIVIFDAGFARSIAGGDGVIPIEFRNQVIFTVLSVISGWLIARVSPHKWMRSSVVIFGVAMLGLMAVKVVGVELNGAQRWIDVGPFNVQPAEFMKIAAIVFIAWVLAKRTPWKTPKKISNRASWLDNVFVPKLVRFLPALPLLFAVYLIEREPDLGTASVVAVVAYAMFCLGGVTKKSILWTTIVGLVLVGAFIKQEPYRVERITNHFHRWEPDRIDDVGYQTVQSEIAMASGGLIGSGIATGRVKHMMPAATTDFVMATVAEEVGLIGTLVILALTAALVWRIWMIADQAATPFARHLCLGVAIWVTVQATVNLVMANGTVPPIGIPYPFISSGGSSLLAIWIGIGLVQSVARMEVEEEKNATHRYRRGNRRTRISRA